MTSIGTVARVSFCGVLLLNSCKPQQEEGSEAKRYGIVDRGAKEKKQKYRETVNEIAETAEEWANYAQELRRECQFTTNPRRPMEGDPPECFQKRNLYQKEMLALEQLRQNRDELAEDPSTDSAKDLELPGCFSYFGKSQLFDQASESSTFNTNSAVGDNNTEVFMYVHREEDHYLFVTLKSGNLRGAEGFIREVSEPVIVKAEDSNCQ